MPLLPRKEEGDGLGAGHVNELSRAAEIVLGTGVPLDRNNFYMREVRITKTDYEGDTDLYTCVPRYWDGSNWVGESTDLIAYPLDPNLDSTVEFELNDQVSAYWDMQRSAFIPLRSGSTVAAVAEDPCPCDCITNPDITVNGIKTSYEFTVDIEEIVEFQTNGTLTLIKNTYTLTNTGSKASPSELWQYDLQDGDYKAFYGDGTDATAATLPNGNIKWQPFLTPKAKLTITLNGTVPLPP